MLAITRRRRGALCGNLIELEEKVEVWFGSLDEIRAKDILSAVLPFASGFRFFKPAQPRACSIDLLCGMIPKGFSGNVSEGKIARVGEYLEAASESQVILVTGSIYLIGEYLSLAKKGPQRTVPSFRTFCNFSVKKNSPFGFFFLSEKLDYHAFQSV